MSLVALFFPPVKTDLTLTLTVESLWNLNKKTLQPHRGQNANSKYLSFRNLFYIFFIYQGKHLFQENMFNPWKFHFNCTPLYCSKGQNSLLLFYITRISRFLTHFYSVQFHFIFKTWAFWNVSSSVSKRFSFWHTFSRHEQNQSIAEYINLKTKKRDIYLAQFLLQNLLSLVFPFAFWSRKLKATNID